MLAQHGDVDVLVAAVDVVHLICTRSQQGKQMSQMVFKVRNTQKQYMRIKLPLDADIWSTVVSGTAVKPARDKRTEEVMVPLKKSSGADASNDSFVVEIVWVQDCEEMVASGDCQLVVPAVDMPLNVVLVSLYLPNGYKYGNFDVSFAMSVQPSGLAVFPLSFATLTRRRLRLLCSRAHPWDREMSKNANSFLAVSRFRTTTLASLLSWRCRTVVHRVRPL